MKTIKQGDLALSLSRRRRARVGPGSRQLDPPAWAFGGTWSRIGPSHHYDRYEWRGYRGYYAPRPYAYYVRRYYDYGYAPGYYVGPGVGFSIGIY
jgi:hypothetical protein